MASGPRALPLSVPRCRTRGPAAGPTGARLLGPDIDPRGVLWGEHKPGRFMWTFGPSTLEAAGHLARGQIPGTPRGRRVSAACSGAQVSAGSGTACSSPPRRPSVSSPHGGARSPEAFGFAASAPGSVLFVESELREFGWRRPRARAHGVLSRARTPPRPRPVSATPSPPFPGASRCRWAEPLTGAASRVRGGHSVLIFRGGLFTRMNLLKSPDNSGREVCRRSLAGGKLVGLAARPRPRGR